MADRTRLTPKKRTAFLASVADGHTIKHAALGIGVSRQAMYSERAADGLFAAVWDVAVEEGTEVLEQEARRRAVDGVTQAKGIYHRGNLVGSVIETTYSDTLLIFLLKARRPATYREKVDVQHSGTVRHEHRHDLRRLSDAELGQLEYLIATATADVDPRRN